MQSGSSRINKELKAMSNPKNNEEGFTVLTKDDDQRHWVAEIRGPADTPYEGGRFAIDIVFPPDYPYGPPKMKFITKIWHPNISSQTGAICLDILKDEWTPALSVRTALLSLQALLCAPEPSSPQDAQVAEEYLKKPDQFQNNARAWVQRYAKHCALYEDKLQRLVDMGFPAEQAREALMQVGGNEEEAIERLAGC